MKNKLYSKLIKTLGCFLVAFVIFLYQFGLSYYTFNHIWSGIYGALYMAMHIIPILVPLSIIPFIFYRRFIYFPIILISLLFVIYIIFPPEAGDIYQQQKKIYFKSIYPRFLKDAKQGNAEAISWMGHYYYYGYADQPDYAKAAEWYQLLESYSSKEGDPKSTVNLGKMYCYGIGVPKNIDLCFKLLTSASGGEYSYINMADLELAYAYKEFRHDEQKAKKLYDTEDDCERGNRYNECNKLGKLYIDKDINLAIKYYTLAAKNDFAGDKAIASAALGDIYYENKFVPANYEEAIRWYEIADSYSDVGYIFTPHVKYRIKLIHALMKK